MSQINLCNNRFLIYISDKSSKNLFPSSSIRIILFYPNLNNCYSMSGSTVDIKMEIDRLFKIEEEKAELYSYFTKHKDQQDDALSDLNHFDTNEKKFAYLRTFLGSSTFFLSKCHLAFSFIFCLSLSYFFYFLIINVKLFREQIIFLLWRGILLISSKKNWIVKLRKYVIFWKEAWVHQVCYSSDQINHF